MTAGMGVANQHADRQPCPLRGLLRGLDGLDQYFVRVSIPFCQRDHIDLHAVLPGEIRLLFGIAKVLVAIGDENDALARVFRE